MRPWIAAVLIGVASSGCASGGAYSLSPTDQFSTRLVGPPASRYAVPPESPKGSVTVASLGTVKIAGQAGGGKVPGLEVRLVVVNDSDPVPWQVDTHAERLSLPGLPSLRPVVVSDGGRPSSTIQIARGQARTIDFFYLLPQGMKSVANISGCDVSWAIRTSTRVVAERTPFERFAPAYDDDGWQD